MHSFPVLLAGLHPLLALLIAVSFVAICMVPIYFFMIVPQMKKRAAEEAAKVARIEAHGKPVYAWLIYAHDDLYNKEKQIGDNRYAQVVYTFQQIPQREQTLESIAGQLKQFRAGPNANEDEVRISRVIQTQFPDFDPARVPASIAGSVTAYTVSVRVPFKKLPEGELTRPYIWCKVLDGETDNVRMIDYPAGR